MTELTTPGRVRRAIREKIKEILLDKTSAGKNVFISRSIPSDTDSLPAILIYTTGERIDDFNAAPKSYKREMSLLIECVSVADSDDELDQMLEDFGDIVESLVEADETLGGIVDSTRITANEFKQDSAGQSPTGRLGIEYAVRYYLEATPELTISDFQGADVDWRLKRPQAGSSTIDAQDELDLQQ